MHLEFSQLYTKTQQYKLKLLSLLFCEMFCAIWTSEETNSLEAQRSTCIRFEVRNLKFV
jgi:hypothetical protein